MVLDLLRGATAPLVPDLASAASATTADDGGGGGGGGGGVTGRAAGSGGAVPARRGSVKGTGGQAGGLRALSVASQFKGQLADLLDRINATRCVANQRLPWCTRGCDQRLP